MVNVISKRCAHSGCTKHPSYGTAGGNRTREFCHQHAKDGKLYLGRSQPSGEAQTSSGRGQVSSRAGSIPGRVDSRKRTRDDDSSIQTAASSEHGGNAGKGRSDVIDVVPATPLTIDAASTEAVAGAKSSGRAAVAKRNVWQTADDIVKAELTMSCIQDPSRDEEGVPRVVHKLICRFGCVLSLKSCSALYTENPPSTSEASSRDRVETRQLGAKSVLAIKLLFASAFASRVSHEDIAEPLFDTRSQLAVVRVLFLPHGFALHSDFLRVRDQPSWVVSRTQPLAREGTSGVCGSSREVRNGCEARSRCLSPGRHRAFW